MENKDLIEFSKRINDNRKIDLFEKILFNSYHEYEEEKNNNLDEFKDSIKIFNNILEKCVILTNKLNLSNSLDIVNFYTLLLLNGYFSINESYEFKDCSNLLNLTGLYELDIIFGQGNCLSNSFFISKLLNKHGIKSFPIHNLLKDSKMEYYQFKMDNYNLDRNYITYDIGEDKCFPIKRYIKNRLGNHVNVFIDEDKKYIYDPTNIAIYKALNKDKAELVTGTGTIDLKLLSSYIFIDNSEQKETLNSFINYNDFNSYTSLDFRKSYNKVIETFKNEQELLSGFKNKIYDDLLFIESDIRNALKYNKKLIRKI